MDVLVMFWLTPPWANGGAGERVAPDDPASYGDALGRMAARYGDRVAAWEVWNEPNSEDFLVGADPAVYASLVAAADDALPASSGAELVFGGVQHADAAWVDAALDAGAAGRYDVMAVHPYPGLADQPPGAPTDGTPYTFLALRDVVDVVRAHGDDVPFWLTEIGWSTHETPPDPGNHERGVDELQQAAYSVETLALLAARFPEVEAVWFYAERDREPDSPDHIDNFGLLRADLSPKPVLRALADHLAATGGSARLGA